MAHVLMPAPVLEAVNPKLTSSHFVANDSHESSGELFLIEWLRGAEYDSADADADVRSSVKRPSFGRRAT